MIIMALHLKRRLTNGKLRRVTTAEIKPQLLLSRIPCSDDDVFGILLNGEAAPEGTGESGRAFEDHVLPWASPRERDDCGNAALA
jgi:hypothetical protein